MTRTEKRLALTLFILALVLFTVRARDNYLAKSLPEPDNGGEYREAVVGEVKYLSPIFAQNDAEKSSSRLLFSGLTKVASSGVTPDVAEKWEVLENGQKYIFTLKKDIVFHDGVSLTARDVIYTVEQIKNVDESGTKSPLYDAWKDVAAEAPDDYHVTFTLPKSYGPFIYKTNFGILPEHISSEEIARKFVGSGPFKFESMSQPKNGKSQLVLRRNESYFADKAKFDQVTLNFFADATEAIKAYDSGKEDGIMGATPTLADSTNLSYQSSRRLGLIFNLSNDKFKEKEVRRKILAGEKFDDEQKIRLVTLNSQLQKDKAEELKRRFASQNVNLELIYLNPIQLNDVLSSKEFEILLYGFDFGYDRDPYVFWHSSEISALNFAGYADKQSDILLEDARMVVDPAERNKKYDQFFEKIKNESLAEFYEPVKYHFFQNRRILGVSAIDGCEAASRYQDITGWYIKEKRVKK